MKMNRLLLTAAVVVLAVGVFAVQKASAEEKKVSDPAKGTPEYTVVKAIEAALAQDFDAYVNLLHADAKPTQQAVNEIERYSWKRFVNQVTWYLDQEKPITIIVTKVEVQPDMTKVFLKRIKRQPSMPAPVGLKKDGDTYKIVTNSL